MRDKLKWLAVARFGTDAERQSLAARLRIRPDKFGKTCPADLALANSARGFYAEEIAKCYLDARRVYFGLDWSWDDDNIVYEQGDEGCSSGPDGRVVTKDGLTVAFDVKSNLHPDRFADVDGSVNYRFSRTHGAELIFWHEAKSHLLHICRRLIPNIDEFVELGSVDVSEYEQQVDEMLKPLA